MHVQIQGEMQHPKVCVYHKGSERSAERAKRKEFQDLCLLQQLVNNKNFHLTNLTTRCELGPTFFLHLSPLPSFPSLVEMYEKAI